MKTIPDIQSKIPNLQGIPTKEDFKLKKGRIKKKKKN